MRAMAGDPLSGEVYKLGDDSYYRVVEGYLSVLPERAAPTSKLGTAGALA